MTGPTSWDVRLSEAAESTARNLPPVTRRALALALDDLAARGPDAAGAPDGDDARVHRIMAGDLSIRVVFSGQDRVALVVGIADGGGAGVTRGDRWPGGALLADLGRDVRVALRGLLRTRAFTLSVVLTLAVGLGGGTAVLGLVNTVYRGAMPFEDPDALVRLRVRADAAAGERVYNMSPRDFDLISRENRVFDGVVGMDLTSLAVRGDEGAERVAAVRVSAGWTDVLGLQPVLGRTFTPEEEAVGEEAGVALISHGVWERYFGGAADVVGRTLPTVGGPKEVVGVMAPRLTYPYDAEVWVPARFDASNWQGHDLNVVARRSPGVSEDAARADMDRLYEALREASPGTVPDDGVHVASLRSDFIRDEGESLQGLAVAVLFLLLLACVNVGILLSVRTVERGRETTLRAVLGASRLRLVRLAVVESTLLFLAGGVAGLGVAAALGEASGTLIPDVLRTQLDVARIRFDPVVVVGALALALLAGGITGGWAALRGGRLDLQGALRTGARGGLDVRTGRLQNGLVTAELALALTLLVGAGVLFRAFDERRSADLGYRVDDVVTMQLAVDVERYRTPEARLLLVDALEERIGALSEVRAVGVTSVNPLCCGDWGASLEVEGRTRSPDAPPIMINHAYVTDGYFRAMGIPLLRGRSFQQADRPGSPPVVVIDEGLARRLWPGEDPLGKRIRWEGRDDAFRTVVGVVPRVHREGDYNEGWYLPLRREPTGRSTEILHVMIHRRNEGALDATRRALAELDPNLASNGGTRMATLWREHLGQDRTGAVLSAAFATVGLLLACLGLAGLLAYRVSLQTREIGTRLALGAQRSTVVRMILARSLRLVVGGLVVGLGMSWLLGEVLARTVEGTRLPSPGLLGGLAAVLALATMAASAVPAARAARLDPARTVQGSG